ncbi:MAG: carbamoyl phosphate synthase small subunit [Clostridia bacterium]|nr:carbamoyl phosphate synthase small subunit [Clostridia bacterium]
MRKKKVYLTLQNGRVFQGYRFGAVGNAEGELVFSTGMVGYVETLTDPSNYGQIVVQTFPLIGNYGINRADAESENAWVAGYVVREFSEIPSNFRSEESLASFMEEKGVIGVYGVDTRELTRILREEGAMNARISAKPLTDEEIKGLSAVAISNAVKEVAPKQQSVYGKDTAKYKVALWNFGSKKSSVETMVNRGWKVVDMPYSATAEEIMCSGVDGVVVGDGPGDPKENADAIIEIKKLLGKLPVFGVGLGHQLVALALGADTAKQKHGHRGSNQPVKCLKCGRVYVSTQNHGYVVLDDSVACGKVQFVNVNDGTCEGIVYDELNAFTVQFAPESCSATGEENPLFKRFERMMEKEKEHA